MTLHGIRKHSIIDIMKTCSHCGKEHPLTEFRKSSTINGGRHYECNTCHARYCRNQRLSLHQITPSEKEWLVLVYQEGVCPVCRKSLAVSDAHIDHAHDCSNSVSHKRSFAGSRKEYECGCKQCIRGALHRRCNSRTLSELEQYQHLQVDSIKTYLSSRPFSRELTG